MMPELRIPKKLIEVALPLDAINVASAREKSIRHGHPSTLHLWWARRPLAAARAIIFAQMVNDPGYERSLGRGMNKEAAQKERRRLFGIMEKLVLWENTTNQDVLNEARAEILKSWKETCALNKDHPEAARIFNPEHLPAFHDPFAGGGAIPLEAQRLGLQSFASDLNPVAITINRAMLEIPFKFKGLKAVSSRRDGTKQKKLELETHHLQGLAEDIQTYGQIVRDLAFKKVGHLYPGVQISKEVIGQQPKFSNLKGTDLTVIAWIWARTAKCENPACGKTFPMLKSLSLSKRNEVALAPKIKNGMVKFDLRFNANEEIPGNVERRTVRCWFCENSMKLSAIEEQGRSSGLGEQLVAVIAEGNGKRVYLPADASSPPQVPSELLQETPSCKIEHWRSCTNCVVYGYEHFEDLFRDRQKAVLNAFSDAVVSIRKMIVDDAIEAGLSQDKTPLSDGGLGAVAYADAIQTYLALAVSKLADRSSSFCGWDASRDSMRNTYARQAIPMVWDFSEANPFSESTGNFLNGIDWIVGCIANFSPASEGRVLQADAATQEISAGKIISTDPPYYDNIPYSNLSDFFYMWLRKILASTGDSLFKTNEVPRAPELVANKMRHGGKKEAEAFFLEGMKTVMANLQQNAHPGFPVTIYYAFKQSETDETEGTSSTGWETFLHAVVSSGFSISGTWPIRTELSNRMLGTDSNALASSVVLVCNRRPAGAPVISRREFIRELNGTLPIALEEMTTGGDHSPVAPVDLSQAIIGPGMAIYSKYSAVLEADGKPMSVKMALQLINRFLAEEDFDHDTQFCLQWFEQHGWETGRFGEADVLARAKGTSVEGLKEAGVIESSGGNLRLYRPQELPEGWRPELDSRVSVWELLHHMIFQFNERGEAGAGELLARAGQFSETIRTLAYRLYTICERKGWSQDAAYYDGLVRAWDSLESAARAVGYSGTQISMFDTALPTNQSPTQTKIKSRKKK